MEELERQKEKYDALEKTWMAANQQFMEFQEIARRDLDLAKGLMTPTQIQHWNEARQRSDFTNYDNQVKRPNMRSNSSSSDIGYKIINENEYEEMQYKINLLTQTVNELENLPVDELQKENEALKSENADLEDQVKFINENYERHQEEKLKVENYLADLEETIEEKIKEHQQESRNENVAKELSVIEDDFIKLKQAVSKRLISLKTTRQYKQEEINEIVSENEFLQGRHRNNREIIHQKIQERLKSRDVQNIVEELQAMLVEEKTSGDLRTKRLLDERARLEESIRELHKNSEIEQRKNYENLQTAKQKKAEVENIRIKLDQETRARKNLEKMYEDVRRKLKDRRAEHAQTVKNIKSENGEIANSSST